MRTARRIVVAAALLLFVGSSVAVAQGPFPAQVQSAFQQLGLWPFGIYADGQVPTWDATTKHFVPGSGGGGGTTAAGDVEAGTFGANAGGGNFRFADKLNIGSGSGTCSTPSAGTGIQLCNHFDPILTLSASTGSHFQIFMNIAGYTMLIPQDGTHSLYVNVPSLVLFDNFGHKTFLSQSPINAVGEQNTFTLGLDSMSQATPAIQRFTAYEASVAVPNAHGGDLRISGGRSNGSMTPGMVHLATSTPGASGSTIQVLSDKLTIADAPIFNPPPTSKPTCDSDSRFKVWAIAGGAGVADTFEICSKDGADVYAWRTLQ